MTETPMSDGLIYAFLLDGQGGGRLLSWQEAQSWQPGQGLLWLHFNYTEEDARQWLREGSGLDPLVTDALLAEDTRPRAAALRNGLLLSLRGVNHNPGADPEDMVSIRLWVTEERIISTRRRRSTSIRSRHSRALCSRSPGKMLRHLLIASMK